LRVVPAAAHPDAPAGAQWFMDYWNSDGSTAEMCGNGARVFVRYLLDAGLVDGLAEGSEVALATRAGIVRASVGDEISVTMPPPQVDGHSTATVDGRTYEGVVVSVGNPHLVCRTTELSTMDLRVAPGHDPTVFPNGVNVEFVHPIEATQVRMRVHERGSGETLSCGSGACAVAAVMLREAGRAGGAVTVDVPGGRLTVTIDAGECRLAGPAVIVAAGEVEPAALGLPVAASH
jgi:diaminopimelate epimerase